MKKINCFLIAISSILYFTNVKAQCTSCTNTITTFDASNHIIGAGQTLSVASTGTLTGLITITAGGALCNDGNINSALLIVSGGALKNYGSINTTNVLISSAGTFTNYASLVTDSFKIKQSNSKYVNNGNQNGNAFSISNGASAINSASGSITAYNMRDSIGSFTNNGNVLITNFFVNTYTSTCTNNGKITVNKDFYNAQSSNFNSTNYLKVDRNFHNVTSSNFATNCMITVGADWYNAGYIYGATPPSCSGFYVAGGSYNSGTIGSPSTHVDICDAGHPASGVDGPFGGTIINTTTFCTCNNVCATTISVKEIEASNFAISNLFPNPTQNYINLNVNTHTTEVALIEITDMMGKIVFNQQTIMQMGDQTFKLNVNWLTEGVYILSITDNNNLKVKRLFTVAN